MPVTVLVTGANRGIGFALTKAYAATGATVWATCPDPSDAAELLALSKENPSVEVFTLDITDKDSIAALAKQLNGRTLDVLVNNAGIISGSSAPITGMTLDETQIFGSIDPCAWEKVLRTNTIGPVMVTQGLFSLFEKSKVRKIVMISSRMGSLNDNLDPDYIAYSSSKTALNVAMKNLAQRLMPEGYIVVSVNPGWVKTRMGGDQANLEPEESAARLLRVISGLRPEQTGRFLNHTGEVIAW